MAMRCYTLRLAVVRSAHAVIPGARASPPPSALCARAPPLQFCVMPRRALTAAVSAEPLQALAQKIAEDSTLAQRLAAEPVAAELLRVAAELPASETLARNSGQDENETPEPTFWQLKTYCKHNLIPFIGFGFFDNAIMILAGDFIDAKLGIAFGFTTMAAAAVGNTISDIIGLWVSGFVEAAAAQLGLPDHGLTNAQRRIPKVRLVKNTSMVVGLVIGCIIGMFPLIYPDEYRVWPARETLEAQAATQ
eukprot:CAMPEP_0171100796 /NCGR_PEP_ID=MMETSP0766_2-20121228/53169_1 /TAXON_ID=439317 /ORGANISM="Gambierdiscus australes, Strain CAWD 149" /LENGTH=248 /DNA_ID=CAMNT_0011560683 /DNA_START=34 /DNA_END=780 /DNA_ORIENTATION=+